MEYRIAWLAGLLDGEGSIGISMEHRPDRPRRPHSFSAAIQMSTTCKLTLDAAMEVIEECGVKGLGYSYQERDPSKHRDAWYLRVNRLPDIAALSPLMIPHAVTKKKHWELMAEYANSRLHGATIDAQGRVHRGGPSLRAYSDREIEIAKALHDLNLRGTAAIKRGAAWQSRAEKL